MLVTVRNDEVLEVEKKGKTKEVQKGHEEESRKKGQHLKSIKPQLKSRMAHPRNPVDTCQTDGIA